MFVVSRSATKFPFNRMFCNPTFKGFSAANTAYTPIFIPARICLIERMAIFAVRALSKIMGVAFNRLVYASAFGRGILHIGKLVTQK